MKISEIGGENSLIDIIKSRFSGPGDGLMLGIGDDAALIAGSDKLTVVTCDLLVENTHFSMDMISPYLLGWKSMAVNISDIAAMGALPTFSFISIGLPDIDISIVEGIYEGMTDVSNKYASKIAGGDTTFSSLGIVINVTQLGSIEQENVIRRDGAKAGDVIIVTNTVGDSRAGLALLQSEKYQKASNSNSYLVEKHLKPIPRILEARAAAKTGLVHSMMDLSDGISADLSRLCRASKAGAKVYTDMLPLSNELITFTKNTNTDAAEYAVSGGEDYELLLTCSEADSDKVISAINSAGSSASVIGEIISEKEITLIHKNGNTKQLPSPWEHF